MVDAVITVTIYKRTRNKNGFGVECNGGSIDSITSDDWSKPINQSDTRNNIFHVV